ncbi:MAG TPA: hypothetical protein VNO51_23305 [Ilumatobacteraceae bacterium]|nr:hypothetical protein [Ilumatobacteraceae bacterium]
MLRASRLLLVAGGRTAFFTIHPAPGLSPSQRRRAHRDGPVAVAAHRPHRELLERAGFIDIDEIDCTAEFATIARAWIERSEHHHDHLVDLIGIAEYERRQRERRTQLHAIEDGLLRRSLLTAARPKSTATTD